VTEPTLRARVYALIEDEESTTPERAWVDGALIVLILTTVLAAILHTVDAVARDWDEVLAAIEWTGGIVFTIEYGCRLWVAVEDRAGRYGRPVEGRLRYALTPAALVDLLAILPFYLDLLLPHSLLVLRTLRVLRILKLARYSPALSLFEVVLLNQRRALLAALTLVLVLMTIAASLIHAAENEAQPVAFSSIPAALWWTVVTMSTVGYGDVVPVTALGKAIAGVVAMLGIFMFALPTAILGAGFTQELQKRNFSLTAAMVARVPLFTHLPPAQLAEITALLHHRQLPARFTVLRRGEHPYAMYFIDDGQLVSRGENGRRLLARGDWFGEQALLHGHMRQTTIITLTACHLLELRASDFHRLIESDRTIRSAITERAQSADEG